MKNYMRHFYRTSQGVTLVEVIFAIGVVLIGLVGLLSILPLAGYRAQDAIDLNTGSNMARSVGNQVLARNWVSSTELAAVGTTPLFGTDALGFRFVRPFCIDPLLAADPPVLVTATPANSYASAFFPFYDRNHDPLLDPSLETSKTSPGFAGQPRMLRAGFSAFASLTVSQQLEFARTLCESPDDLNVLRPKDRTVPSTISGLSTGAASTVAFGRAVPTGEYNWIITVDPFPGGEYASMSVVILRNRERANQFPDNNQATPQGNARAERVAVVSNAVGFVGGAGGSVTLLSSGNTVSELRSNDWIMLSRTGSPNVSNPERTAVHRWYRVVSTGGDAELITPDSNTDLDGDGNADLPNVGAGVDRTTSQVWRQTVLLDGPDWDFVFTIPTNAATNTLTYATLMDDVVAVSEQTISIAGF